MKSTIEGYDESDKNAIPLIGPVSAITNASDKAFTNVEQTLHKHLSSDVDRHLGIAPACSLCMYIDHSDGDRNANPIYKAVTHDELSMQFASDQYFTTKRISLAFNLDNFLLQQKLFLDSWLDLSEYLSAENIINPGDITQGNLYSLCAQYASILYERGVIVFPSTFDDQENQNKYNTGILVSAAVSLVTAVATYSDIEDIPIDSDLIYENCLSLLSSRYQSIEEIFLAKNSLHLYEKFLATWTPRIA